MEAWAPPEPQGEGLNEADVEAEERGWSQVASNCTKGIQKGALFRKQKGPKEGKDKALSSESVGGTKD